MKKSKMLLELIDSFEEMYLGMLDATNSGHPSFVIRYSAAKATIDIVKKDPSDWPAMDKLFIKFLENEIARLKPRLFIKTIQID